MNTNDLLSQLRAKQSLEQSQVKWMIESLLEDSMPAEEKVELLRALTSKGETVEEIVGFVEVLLTRAVRPVLNLPASVMPIDVCGTGGDKLEMFNVSSTSMFVLAGAGVPVVKHGNRGITSKSGGADVLAALGIRIDLPPEKFSTCVEQTGAGFMFAPNYHPAFKAIAPIRKVLAEEGTRTIFNLIGPLLNPVQPPLQLVGVADGRLTENYARILSQLGRKKAWAVHGTTASSQGMDEISTLAPSTIAQCEAGKISTFTLDPSTLDIGPATLGDLQGGSAEENAVILTGILSGKFSGPRRDIVALNAAAGLQVAGKAANWIDALAQANHILDAGLALKSLHAMQEFSRSQPA